MISKKITSLLSTLCFLSSVSLLAQSIDIEIMSFNIQQPYGNNWDERKDSAVAIIRIENPDIIGTQEAINSQRAYLLDSTEGYAYYGLGRDGGDNGEGSWIFYKTEKFQIDSLKSGDFWLSDTPDKPSRFAGDYNRICTYAKLIDKTTGISFYVFNAHFPTPDLQSGRMKSMKLLSKVMADISLENDPILLTGDFNSSESDAVTKWMKNGENNPFQCNDTYRDAYPDGNVTTGFGTKFDYIYCEKNSNYKVQDSWVIKEPTGASDHYPIAASLTLFFSDNGNKLPIANADPDIHIIDSTASIEEYEFWLDASSSYDIDGLITSFEWYHGNELLFSQGSSTLNLPVGNYPIYLKVTDELGGVSYDQLLITFDWYEEEIVSNNKINNHELFIYPIPVNDVLYVNYNTKNISKLKLFDAKGSVLKEIDNSSQIHMAHFNPGIYYLQVTVNGQTIIKKIIKK